MFLNISGTDNFGLVNELTKTISSNMNVNIRSLNISGSRGIFEGKMSLGIKNNKQLQQLIKNIKKIDGIEKVERIHKH